MNVTPRERGTRARRGLAVTNAWPPMTAGSGRAFQALLAASPDVVVLAPREPVGVGDGGVPSPVGRGPSVRRVLRWSGGHGGRAPLRSLLQHLEIVLAPLRAAAQIGRPTWLFASQPVFSGVGALLLAWLCDAPCVVMAHGEEFGDAARAPGSVRARLLRCVVARADAIVCNTEHTRHLALAAGCSAERLHVLPPALDLAEFDAAYAAARAQAGATGAGHEPVLLMAGRLWQTQKGFDHVIAALPAIRRAVPSVRLRIVGPGDPAPLREAAAAHGVADALELLGEVDRATLLEEFARCHAFVMPGREVRGAAEGFGIVYLEAAAVGKPVVAGRAGGAGEAVLDGVTGLVVDGADVDAIAAASIRLLTEPALAARLGAQARRRVEAEFDVRERWRRLDALVGALVAARPRSGRRRLPGHA